MEQTIYIGIDDTDTLDSVGTGRVAKGLAKYLAELGLVRSLGVSRHQLLVHDSIRFTSHNSSKGLAVITEKAETDLYTPSIEYMRSIFIEGSDPGLCICPANKINKEVLEYGESAKVMVLVKERARELAARYSIFLKELGGDGGGIIGALAAVGLRAGGNDGRLVELRGIKEISGHISVAELKSRTDIVTVRDSAGHELAGTELIESQDWIRPTLVGHQAILRVRPVENSQNPVIWQQIEQKHRSKEKVKNDE
jgi:hypothetical protein